MSSVKFPVVTGHVIRGTRLDSCGRPAWGNKTQIATEGFVSIAQTANYDDGDEITVKNARGRRCVQKDAEPELINASLDVTFCNMDPEFYTLLTGFPVIYHPITGDAIGYRANRGVRPGDVRVALEAWTGAQGTVVCDDDGDVPYGYLLWPFLSGGRVGDYTLENNAVTFSVTGMLTKDGSGWGLGPYDVVTDDAGDPAPLPEVIDALDHWLTQVTTIQPPESTIGLVPLDDPDQSSATGVTAGAPGSFTPAGSVRPYDLTELRASSITASPLTAWTTGQHVILGDGSFAYWDSNSYEPGKAP